MKYLKKFLCLMLSMLFIITTFSGCSTLNPDNIESNITKGEWFNLLKENFGFETNEKKVVIDNEKETQEYAIRALKSWDVIDDEDSVNINERISKSYALATAIFAVGEQTTKLNREETSEKKAADFAVDKHIGDSKSFIYMSEGLTEDEAKSIIDKSIKFYHNRKFETYDKSVYKDNLQVEKDTESYRVDSVNKKISVDSDKNKYKKGDVVLFGEGVDAKVVEIENIEDKNGKSYLNYRIADTEQFMESVDVSGSGTVEKASDVKTGDGCELVSFNGQSLVGVYDKPTVEPLGKSNEYDIENTAAHENPFGLKKNDLMDNDADLGLEVSLGSGGTSIKSNRGFGTSAEIKDKVLDENGEEIERDVIDKWEKNGQEYKKKAGFKITGKINIDDFSVDGNVKYDTFDSSYYNMKKWQWESVDTNVINPFKGKDAWYYVKVNSKISNSLSIEGYISEEIKLCSIPVPIGPITVTVDVKLKQKYNGKLEVSLVINNSTEISWDGNKGFKNTANTAKEMNFTVEATYEADLGIELGIGIAGKDIIDCGASIGFKATVSFKNSSLVLGDEGLFLHGGDESKLTNKKEVRLLCYEISEKFPIVKVSVNNGDSLFADISEYLTVELGGEWTITEGWELKQHIEHNNGLVDNCLKDSLTEYDADSDSKEKTTEKATEISDESINEKFGLQIDTYAVDVGIGENTQVNITSVPTGCDISDIDVSIDNENVASVSKKDSAIVVEGLSDGIATVTVSCSSTNESINFTIMVIE